MWTLLMTIHRCRYVATGRVKHYNTELQAEQATDTRCSHFSEELRTMVYAYVINAHHVQPRRQIKYCIVLEPCKMSIVNMHLCPAKISLSWKKLSVSYKKDLTAKKERCYELTSGTTHWELQCCRFQINASSTTLKLHPTTLLPTTLLQPSSAVLNFLQRDLSAKVTGQKVPLCCLG